MRPVYARLSRPFRRVVNALNLLDELHTARRDILAYKQMCGDCPEAAEQLERIDRLIAMAERRVDRRLAKCREASAAEDGAADGRYPVGDEGRAQPVREERGPG